MLPDLISKIKSEVREEIIELSRVEEPEIEEPKKEVPKVVHHQYICDGCEMHGIVGPRFKCAVCSNMDLC